MAGLPVQPGDVLAGRYEVERVLGSGGMGVVVAAVHLELRQRVALKFLLPSALQHAEAASRFLREARAVVKIDSEHVARVLDVGKLDDGAPYLVMEYLEGSDLSTCPAGEALPIEDAVDFVLQACAAMAVAHSVGIIHRDLKPANLFVTSRPDGSPLVKVLDFGISKMSLLDSQAAALTHTSAIMGSPLYMSPEQAQSARTVDARTDIWSLGVISYELLTGVTPFRGESLTEVLSALITTNPRPIRELRPSVPAGLEQAVLRALEKPLERRFANVGELSAALVEFAPSRSRLLHERVSGVLHRAGISSMPPPSIDTAGGTPVGARVSTRPESPATAGVAPGVSGTDTNWVGRERPPSRRLRWWLLAGGMAALVVGVFALLHRAPAAPGAASVLSAATSLVPTVSAAPTMPSTTAAPAAPGAPTVSDEAPPGAAPAATASGAEHAKPALPPRAVSARAAPKSTDSAAAEPFPTPTHRKKNPLSIEFK